MKLSCNDMKRLISQLVIHADVKYPRSVWVLKNICLVGGQKAKSLIHHGKLKITNVFITNTMHWKFLLVP
ncbi:hypothetical protein EB796_020602 [Bugula neritina]|uniref:Uncharacterized protein n=1 Tax=Bugula neritina TaxID=10212 RepID=A0A7J7J4R7_BUGNE|nr:hypothetical protein EB796_020602 [Bugula neritina]